LGPPTPLVAKLIVVEVGQQQSNILAATESRHSSERIVSAVANATKPLNRSNGLSQFDVFGAEFLKSNRGYRLFHHDLETGIRFRDPNSFYFNISATK